MASLAYQAAGLRIYSVAWINAEAMLAHFALHCDGDPEPVELSLAEVCGGAGCQRRWSDVRVCDVHAQPVFGGRAVELAASRSSKSVVRKGGEVWPLTAALYSDVSRWPAFVARRPNFHAWLDYHAAQGVGCFFVYEASEEGAELLREWTASARGGCAVALPWRFVPRGGSKRFLALPKDFVTQEIQEIHSLQLLRHATPWVLQVDVDEFVAPSGDASSSPTFGSWLAEVDAARTHTVALSSLVLTRLAEPSPARTCTVLDCDVAIGRYHPKLAVNPALVECMSVHTITAERGGAPRAIDDYFIAHMRKWCTRGPTIKDEKRGFPPAKGWPATGELPSLPRVVASKVPIAKAQLLGRLQPQLAARWKLSSYCNERTGYAGFVV